MAEAVVEVMATIVAAARRLACTAGRSSLLPAILSTAAAAPQGAPPEAPAPVQPRTLTVQNLAPFRRQEWVAVPVPFARGAVRELPDLHVDGHATVWQPFGARWPDGSLRQALCMFRPELQRLAERRFALVPGRGPEVDGGGEGATATAGAAEAERNPVPEIAFVVQRGDQTVAARPQFVRFLEQNAAREVALLTCRIGDTGLVGELILERWRGQSHLGADVAVFFSDPRTKAMQCDVQLVAIDVRGMSLILRHPGLLAIDTLLSPEPARFGSRSVLLRDTTLGDGQGIRRTGVLVPPLRGDRSLRDTTLLAATVCPLLGATRWQESGAWGPFGYVPEPPPLLANEAALRRALAARHAAFVEASRARGDPFWAGPFGLARNAGQTGDQADFGVSKMEPVAATGLPSFLLEVEPSVLQEACRPVHFFEADASPVDPADHPQWVVWSGRTHWHCDVSKDRLGKPCPEPPFEAHGFGGKDRQHWSSNYLTQWYLLTGAHWARREIENEVRLYLAGQTVDPQFSTSGPDAPRGAGRVMHTASWLWQCTGDERLLQRMRERVHRVYLPSWEGRELPPEKVRPMAANTPDARMLDGAHDYWTPWQDSLAAIGFAAYWRTTGDEAGKELAKGLALNCLRHGWKLEGPEAPIIATAVVWRGGEPVPAAELATDDKSVVVWSHGTAFSHWAIGAVELARQFAAEDGDTALVARATDILERLRAGRPTARDGWFDRFGEWDAVR